MREPNVPVAIQSVFTAGELSKRMSGRLDTDVYKAGLAECANFFPLPQGPLFMRGGAERLTKLWGGSNARIIEFQIAGEEFTLELSDLEMRVYSSDGAYLEPTGVSGGGPNPELVGNGDFALGLDGWTTFGDAEVAAGALVLNYNWTYNSAERFWFEDTSGASRAFNIPLAGLYHVSFKVSGVSADRGEIVYVTIGDYSTSVTANGTYSATVPMTLGAKNVNLGVELTGISHYDGSVTLDDISCKYAGEEEIPTETSGLVSPWTIEQVRDVQYDVETAKSRMVLVHGNHAPRLLSRDGAGAWTLVDLSNPASPSHFTAAPAAWADANWPSTVAFHAGRLYLGGTPDDPNHIWASRAGHPFDFTLATGPVVDAAPTQLPGDAIDIQLATKGKLTWMREANHALVVATDMSEHSVTGSKGVPLNGDYSFLRQSAYGSAPIQAVDASDSILFVSPDKRRIRALGYKERDGWRSRDITFLADHITEGGVRELHFTQLPDGLAVAVLETGGIVLCSLDLVEGIVGWFRFNIAGGVVRSASLNRRYLKLAVERGAEMSLERIPLSTSAEALYFDSSVSRTADGAGTVSGLGHLEGETIGVRTETEFLGEFVVAAGAVALGIDYANVEVQAGLRYRAKAKTLPRHLTGKVRVPQVSVLLNDSALPLVNGERPAERDPATNLDESVPQVTGVFDVTDLEWDEGGAITIEQDLPFRTEVCAILGGTKSNEV